MKRIAVLIMLILLFSIGLLFLSLSSPVEAFYEWQDESGSFELRGMARGFAMAYEYPENDFFYEKKSVSGGAALARLLMQGRAGQHLGFELNVYQTYIPTSLSSSQGGFGTPLDVERSSFLEWSFSDIEYVHLAIDRLNLFWTHDPLDIIVGRQPVNLATTFYFTPNDFFAPFAAQAFYRVYKPGVDTVRAEVRLGDFSQLSLISVLGYEPDPDSDTGWSEGIHSDRNSYVGRISTVIHDFEWSIIGGTVREKNVIGGSIQGEMFQWLGIRAEGHFADPDDSQKDSVMELSVGVEHRWENSLDLRLEQFYHGCGVDAVSDYRDALIASDGESVYLGRNYTALGAGYEFTPLLNAQILAITNLMDHSHLLSFNAVYSLADEAELAFNLGIPMGKEPKVTESESDQKVIIPEIESEFGLYPYSANMEVRCYF